MNKRRTEKAEKILMRVRLDRNLFIVANSSLKSFSSVVNMLKLVQSTSSCRTTYSFLTRVKLKFSYLTGAIRWMWFHFRVIEQFYQFD